MILVLLLLVLNSFLKLNNLIIIFGPIGPVHLLLVLIMALLDFARANNYHVILLGDFNIDEIAHSSYPSRHFKLLRLLISHYFTDYQAHSSPLTGSDCTYFYNNGSSLTPCPDLLDRPFTDHRVLITIFDFNSCFAILVKSRFKQKKEGQSVFTYTSTTDKQWEKFSSKANTGFQLDAAISGPYVDHDFL
ncbi:unnamed protein product [Rhizophagus irregularis]|nr:unnamed protein product [Rhizophagus irregularis]